MRLYRPFWLILSLLILAFSNPSQAQLSAGDIAIIGMNTDGSSDQFTIVCLVDIPASTSISFSDKRWDGSALQQVGSAGSTLEGTFSWTPTTAISAGEIYRFSAAPATSSWSVAPTNGAIALVGSDNWTSSLVVGSPFNDAVSDNLFIFTGSESSPNFIYGFLNSGSPSSVVGGGQPSDHFWHNSDLGATQISRLPTSLTNALASGTNVATAVAFTGSSLHGDDIVYTGTLSGTRDEMLTALGNKSNWSQRNDNPYDISVGGSIFSGTNPVFTISGGTPEVTLSASVNSASETGGAIVLTATASTATSSNLTVPLTYAGTATSGVDYSGAANITINSGATTGTLTLTTTSDAQLEGDESISVAINSSTISGATVGTPSSVSLTVVDDDFKLDLKVFLEGPLSVTSMSTHLNDLLPANPTTVYSSIVAESSSGILGTAVDWVVVELRTGTAASTKVGTNRAALLHSDGTITDREGDAFTMSQIDGSSYYMVIHHRNHLSVMSSSALSPSVGVYTFDFTVAQANNYSNGADGAVQVGSVFAMTAGDADDNGAIGTSDLDAWRVQNGVAFVYGSNGEEDLNLDGAINVVDRNEYQQSNTGKSSQVPN